MGTKTLGQKFLKPPEPPGPPETRFQKASESSQSLVFQPWASNCPPTHSKIPVHLQTSPFEAIVLLSPSPLPSIKDNQ